MGGGGGGGGGERWVTTQRATAQEISDVTIKD